jgi:hypothetical protein
MQQWCIMMWGAAAATSHGNVNMEGKPSQGYRIHLKYK